MNDDSLFAEALKYSTAQERVSFLDKACGNDREQRQRVEALLAAHEKPDSYFERGAIDGHATLLKATAEHAGMLVDRYKLLQEIGEGGFGVVYMAEQQKPVHRKVAVKIIKPGMDSRQVIAGLKLNDRHSL